MEIGEGLPAVSFSDSKRHAFIPNPVPLVHPQTPTGCLSTAFLSLGQEWHSYSKPSEHFSSVEGFRMCEGARADLEAEVFNDHGPRLPLKLGFMRLGEQEERETPGWRSPSEHAQSRDPMFLQGGKESRFPVPSGSPQAYELFACGNCHMIRWCHRPRPHLQVKQDSQV